MRGDVEICLPKSIFSRNHDSRSKRSLQEELQQKNKLDLHNFKSFKFEQRILPDNSEARKLPRACEPCFPNHSCQLDEDVKTLGIRNLFHIETEDDYQPFHVRWLSSWCHVSKTAFTSAEQMQFLDRDNILEDAIDSLGDKCSPKQKKTVKKLSKDLYLPFVGFCGTVSFFRITGWIVRKVFKMLFESFCVHQGEMELLRRTHLTGLPIIYIPINRSVLDPFIMFFTLQSVGLSTPYFFSTRIQRYWGKFIGGIGFNINEKKSEELCRNTLSISCFRNLLKKRASFILNLEQQRSKSGKPSTELYGVEMLHVLYNSWLENEVEDAYIVPVNVSYEHLIEHLDEKNWALPLIKQVIGCIFGRHRLGSVRVNFGQPFTLREFQSSTKTNGKFKMLSDLKHSSTCLESYVKTFPGSELCWDTSLNSALSSSLSSIYNLPYPDDQDEDKFLFLDALAFHSIWDSMQSTTVMATHIVSFLLLKKFRYGVAFETLVREVRNFELWFKNYALKDVGFSGDHKEIVFNALEVLGPDAVSITKKDDSVHVNPILSSESIEKLGYYSNIVLPFFAMEGVVAVALFATIGNCMTTSMGFEHIANLKINDDTLVRETRKVYAIFTTEFFLHSPCITTIEAIRQVFVQMDKFLTPPDKSQKPSKGYEAEIYDDDSDEDWNEGGDTSCYYKVINSKESYSDLSFLRKLLCPYLEIYAKIALELECLADLEEPYDFEVMEKILETLKTTFSIEEYGEYLTLDVVRNAFCAFESQELIYFKLNKETKLKYIFLFDPLYSIKQLRELSTDLLHYVTF